MAKLEGVKTIDMVNGEITKVAYGGAEYLKTEGLPKENDLVLAEEGGYDITYGAFYKITEDADHDDDVRFLDDVNDERVRDDDDYVLFRKVSAGIDPSLEERVSSVEADLQTLKSDVAALKGEAGYVRIDKSEAQDGDYVKFDEAPKRYLTAGKYYEIDYVDSCGDPWITDDDGDDFDTQVLCDDEFEVYRKVSDASVEADRLKVGDYAKVVNATDYHCFTDGDIVEIVKDIAKATINECARRLKDGKNQYVPKRQLVRATDEEVAEAKDAAARAKFKEGAKVRLKSGGGEFPLLGFENGKIYKVSDNNFDHEKGKRIRIEGGDCFLGSGCATPDQLEILTEEEVAEIERKQAEEAKWAKIGRKVGEYKEGDIARVINASGSSNMEGDIGEITRINGTLLAVETPTAKFGNLQLPSDIELITPVEARFDR
ncbi:hypothetical protein QRX25_14895 [Bacillus sp. L381]|uniref:hypothetical protein n=1 Tax=Bacillus TaxID=1386 RepID=UPI001BA77811|nr:MULTISPECIES: hypothetical protein [Bacillus]MCR9040810.1 hypothetical protein [Bacillus velezensis]QUN08768.1 hypothetical protein KEF49_14690 [Bacillus amyloliquefaciens]QYM81840.1 hypothetical protein KTJ85_14535 [Bacillus sp. 7D3]QZY10986.1 hypothetical protein K7B13_14790 [Bacillus amyloliquefaciens]WIX20888.1 hypothetical protein QRX25_14895 [Bacillus sp. L381]